MPVTIDQNEFMHVSEAGRRLGLSAIMVRKYADRGQLQAVRGPGGHRLLRRADVERMAAERERKGRRRADGTGR